MDYFPCSAHEVRQLALKLLDFLKQKVEYAPTRQDWTCQNFRLLQKFFGKGKDGLGLDCFPNDAKGEFLWDFVAYIPYCGNLLVAESEWDNKEQDDRFTELEKDFEKLLYARSPLKLFMCWNKNPEQAERVIARLQLNIKENCTYYSPGEVFIVYFTWRDEGNGKEKKDIAYILQVSGEPKYQPINGERFEIVAK